MKKTLISLLIVTLCVGLAFAAYITKADYESAQAGTGSATANFTANSNRALHVYTIIGASDLSTSKLTINEGATSGTTDNYTAVGYQIVGTTGLNLGGENTPIFVGKRNYQYQFLVDGTSSNAVIVTGEYR